MKKTGITQRDMSISICDVAACSSSVTLMPYRKCPRCGREFEQRKRCPKCGCQLIESKRG